MGLFDGVFKNDMQFEEEYRKHLEHLKMQQAVEAEPRHIQAAQQQMYGAAIGPPLGTQQAYNSLIGMGAQKPTRPVPRFDPNTSEAFQIPLSQAITMWQVKHGDKWFDGHQPRPEEGKDFYADVFARIKKEGLFENIDGWFRLKENVEKLLANH